MAELEARDGMGKCNDCVYHYMDGYDHYCLSPRRVRQGEKRRWMNETFSRDWHGCCIVFKDDE